MIVVLALFLLVIRTSLSLIGAGQFLDGIGDPPCAFSMSVLVLGVILAELEPEALAVGNVINISIIMVMADKVLSDHLCPTVIRKAVRRQALITIANSFPFFPSPPNFWVS